MSSILTNPRGMKFLRVSKTFYHLFPSDLVPGDALGVLVRPLPVEEPDVGPDVGEAEVQRLGGEHVEPLEGAVGQHGHVLDAPEVLVVDLGHVAGADPRAHLRHLVGGAAVRVVGPVVQAAQHVAGPGSTDHEVGNGHSLGVQGITEGVDAAGMCWKRKNVNIQMFLGHSSCFGT